MVVRGARASGRSWRRKAAEAAGRGFSHPAPGSSAGCGEPAAKAMVRKSSRYRSLASSRTRRRKLPAAHRGRPSNPRLTRIAGRHRPGWFRWTMTRVHCCGACAAARRPGRPRSVGLPPAWWRCCMGSSRWCCGTRCSRGRSHRRRSGTTPAMRPCCRCGSFLVARRQPRFHRRRGWVRRLRRGSPSGAGPRLPTLPGGPSRRRCRPVHRRACRPHRPARPRRCRTTSSASPPVTCR